VCNSWSEIEFKPGEIHRCSFQLKSICHVLLPVFCLGNSAYCFRPSTTLICSGVIFITAKTAAEGKKSVQDKRQKHKECRDKGDAGEKRKEKEKSSAIKQFNVICSTTSTAIICDGFPSLFY
jgi:hypothetical protein